MHREQPPQLEECVVAVVAVARSQRLGKQPLDLVVLSDHESTTSLAVCTVVSVMKRTSCRRIPTHPKR